QSKSYATVAQVIAQRFDDLGIRKAQQSRLLFDDDDSHAECCEHRSVLHSNHAAANYYERLRVVRHLQYLIAVDDRSPVDRDSNRCSGLRSRSDDDKAAFAFG